MRKSEHAACDIMQAHIDALNTRDEAALIATLHFPHFRLSGTNLKTWQTPQDYFADFRQRAGVDWGYSSADDIKILAASPNKAHLDVRICRFRADHTMITQFRSLWVMIVLDGRWGAKFRSSFAGD